MVRVLLRWSVRACLIPALSLFFVPDPALGASPRCVVRDNGLGTATCPPSGVPGYRSPGDPHDVLMIENGLPPGSQLLGRFIWRQIAGGPEAAGGSLGGTTRSITGSQLVIDLVGTGALAGYARRVILNPTAVADFAPRTLGASPQSFATDLAELLGQLPIGDPDFDLLRIAAGTTFGYPSPGHTTLTRQVDGDWQVDSFFDITYRIDFIGRFGGPFSGMSGSTVSGARIYLGRPPRRACESNDFAGVAQIPCDCESGYTSDPDTRVLLNGLPPGEPITGKLRIIDVNSVTSAAGGSLGGDTQTFGARVTFDLVQHGGSGYQRQVTIPVTGESESGPTNPGLSPQGLTTELTKLTGQIIGDPDFDLLRITAGSSFGYPSPGHTTWTFQPTGRWSIDSFFDITYRVDFVGAVGGPFAGMSGSTTWSSRFEQGVSRLVATCLLPDAGGTAKLPLDCPGGYGSPSDAMIALNGLPPGEPIIGTMRIHSPTGVIVNPGGPLEGDVEIFGATIDIALHGTGSMSGFSRSVSFPVNATTASGPRVPGATPQDFPVQLVEFQGQLPAGDPDFDLLRIAAGSVFGYPGPGHTTLHQSGPNWAVDSFFDISYRIDFVGAPGGALAGLSGSTPSENRFQIGEGQNAGVGARATALRLGAARPNPAFAGSQVELELPVTAAIEAGIYDLAGRRIVEIARGTRDGGRHVLHWDGRLASGARAAAGLYFYRVRALDREAVSRVAVVY